MTGKLCFTKLTNGSSSLALKLQKVRLSQSSKQCGTSLQTRSMNLYPALYNIVVVDELARIKIVVLFLEKKDYDAASSYFALWITNMGSIEGFILQMTRSMMEIFSQKSVSIKSPPCLRPHH